MIRSCGSKSSLQLANAGRKSMVDGFIFGPSAIPHSEKHGTPQVLTTKKVQAVVEAFRSAAERAVDTVFDCLEINAAHGYLIHEFLSPLSNKRDDQYGGSPESRSRLLLKFSPLSKAYGLKTSR
jgi:NADPH2 dehydrogenase